MLRWHKHSIDFKATQRKPGHDIYLMAGEDWEIRVCGK